LSLIINPETKVGALLDAYPGIDEQLIAWVPAFSKLRNPILRKTVAKVATLEQAAQIGGIGVRELVRKLREVTGQPLEDQGCGPYPHGPAPAVAEPEPEWLRRGVVCHEMDADGMLAAGEHPIGRIRMLAGALGPGQMIRLTSSFYPAPLIETMRRGGLAVYSHQEESGRSVTYFAREA
jgi:hypothetical protein